MAKQMNMQKEDIYKYYVRDSLLVNGKVIIYKEAQLYSQKACIKAVESGRYNEYLCYNVNEKDVTLYYRKGNMFKNDLTDKGVVTIVERYS